MVEHTTMENAIRNEIDLSSNAFMLIHGWTAGPLLLEFVSTFLQPLEIGAKTAEELTTETGAKQGPLNLLLRACTILGYLDFDPLLRTYSLVQGSELDELVQVLRPTGSSATALSDIYAKAIPPFEVPSDAAQYCFLVWTQHRPAWRACGSRGLAILLDGIVLVPLLTSITYSARCNEDGLDLGKNNVTESFSFDGLDAASRRILSDIFIELGISATNANGVMTMSQKGALAMQRCYSYYVPASYSPMLAEFRRIVLHDAGWGFVDVGEATAKREACIERKLHKVGKRAQHQAVLKDLMCHIDAVFGGENFSSQPKFVVETGCEDGHLLMHVYNHVRQHTPRGRVLKQYPLTMVGVDFSEESRLATAVSLSKRGIPHMVLFGDIGEPAKIMAALSKKNVDLAKTLHVRSFLDHARVYMSPTVRLREDSPTVKYAKAQMMDFVHLDKHGLPITATEVFASLVEHFVRWGEALQGSFGLCMLEEMMLDITTTKHFFSDSASFHCDIVQCLSRQYMISPSAFAMAAAMAGLFPANYSSIKTSPKEAKYCRVISQHLVKRPFKVRLAELSDLPSLLRLEEIAWAKNLRASMETLRLRLETSPTTNLVCEVRGKVVAVLYMQLVNDLRVVNEERFMEISAAHSPQGRVVQLIAIAVDPEVGSMGIGTELKAFALLLAKLDAKIDTVIAVTLCRNFKTYAGTMEQYVASHASGKIVDPTLDFHTGAGAKIVQLVHGFRPEDVDNNGIGVLIQYDLAAYIAEAPLRPKPSLSSGKATLEVLTDIMRELGYEPDMEDAARGFFSYGIDSVELISIRNQLGSALSMDLPATLLLDFPTVKDLAEHLDKVHFQRDATDVPQEAMTHQEQKHQKQRPQLQQQHRTSWESLNVSELLDLQEQCKRTYAMPQYQNRFAAIARKCYPDVCKYALAIEHILVEVEGQLMSSQGLIQDKEWATIQKGRREMTKCVAKYWHEFSEVRALGTELLHVTKQDQQWQ